MQKLISVDEAAAIIQDQISSRTDWPTEIIPLSQAQGRILRHPVTADRPIPPFDRIMMDGITIRHSIWELGRQDFTIEATQAAGAPPISLQNSQSCIEVMTGGVLPDGCDCVIPVEEITVSKQTATLNKGLQLKKGQHIHKRGSDTSEGTVLLPAGQTLHPPELSIAASCGATSLTVSTLPRIALLSTGDELVAPNEQPQTHQIRRSHATALNAIITAKQLGSITEQHVPDQPELLKKYLNQALIDYDLVVLTGGVSRGKYDYVAPVLQQLLGDPRFHGVAQRPGKPLAFWAGDRHPPVLALPGNPVSVMACAARYLIPALKNILTGEPLQPETLPANGRFNCPPHFTGLIPCRIKDGTLELVPPSNSGNFLSLAGTHGIAEIPGKLARTNLKSHPAVFYPW